MIGFEVGAKSKLILFLICNAFFCLLFVLSLICGIIGFKKEKNLLKEEANQEKMEIEDKRKFIYFALTIESIIMLIASVLTELINASFLFR